MNKLLTAVLYCTVLSAQATTCPPASAFMHAGPYQDWKLQTPYRSEWRIAYNPLSNEVTAQTLHSNARLTVRLFPSHINNGFFEECRYEVPQMILWVYSQHDYQTDPSKFPNFHSQVFGTDTNYLCNALAGTASVCAWE